MELTSSNKVRLICLLIVGPSLISLNTYGEPCYSFQGYNVGGGLGAIQFASSISTSASQNRVSDYFSGYASALGAKGNLYAGYSTMYHGWLYLAGEVGLNITSRRQVDLSDDYQSTGMGAGRDDFIDVQQGFLIESDNFTVDTSVSRNLVEPTLDFKIGGLLAPNLLSYARLGLAYNRISVNSSTVLKATGIQSVDFQFFPFASASYAHFNQAINTSTVNNVLGLRAGLGFVGMITEKIGISTDYIFTFYNSANVSRNANANQLVCDLMEGCHVDNNGKYKVSSKTRASEQEILLQLVYYLS